MARLSKEKVKQEISNAGYSLVSDSYKNLDTPLEIKCSNNHTFFASLKQIRKGIKCPNCEKLENKKIMTKLAKKEKGTVRVLAIDQSTHKNGFAVFDDESLVYSSFFDANGKDQIERMMYVRDWLISCIKTWRLDAIAIEDIQLQTYGRKSQVSTYKVLAQLQGILLSAAFEMNIPIHIIHVQTWRAYTGITAKKRQDAKNAAKIKVRNRYGVEVTDDEAEAVCIGRYMAEKYMKNNTMYEW